MLVDQLPLPAGGQLFKTVFDQPVLQRMERNNPRPSADADQLLQRAERALYTAQLIIDGDAQGLKSLRGRMDFASAAHGAFHDVF